MKLPTFLSDTVHFRQGIHAAQRPRPSAAALQLQAPAGCIDRCVGPNAASKCQRCGGDLDCWESCAGSGSSACVNACFLTDLGKAPSGY